MTVIEKLCVRLRSFTPEDGIAGVAPRGIGESGGAVVNTVVPHRAGKYLLVFHVVEDVGDHTGRGEAEEVEGGYEGANEFHGDYNAQG